PLRDEDGVIAGWRERIARLPEPLARTMAEHHLALFPYWRAHRQLAARDARLFELQSLLDGAFRLVGALSAVNGLYFTTFQFKRTRAHVAALAHAPHHLARPLESLFPLDADAAP